MRKKPKVLLLGKGHPILGLGEAEEIVWNLASGETENVRGLALGETEDVRGLASGETEIVLLSLVAHLGPKRNSFGIV